MQRRHQRTLTLIFARPAPGGVKWRDVEALLIALGAEITEREGARIGVRLFGDRRVFHRPIPHLTPTREPLKIFGNGLK